MNSLVLLALSYGFDCLMPQKMFYIYISEVIRYISFVSFSCVSSLQIHHLHSQ